MNKLPHTLFYDDIFRYQMIFRGCMWLYVQFAELGFGIIHRELLWLWSCLALLFSCRDTVLAPQIHLHCCWTCSSYPLQVLQILFVIFFFCCCCFLLTCHLCGITSKPLIWPKGSFWKNWRLAYADSSLAINLTSTWGPRQDSLVDITWFPRTLKLHLGDILLV